MTGSAAVSVVVVSRGRPDSLRRCLIGLSQLRYPAFEVVIVTDADGRAMLRGTPQAAYAKIVAYDEANISAARNLGIEQCDGDLVAFIDDDAVPEPSWLMHLAAPFSLPEVVAAGGFVRGRNGISWQWKAQSVDRTGQTRALEVDAAKPTLLTASPEQGVKTQGTNMMMRRDLLMEIGGFDPNFRFFLDETDLNLRLAARQSCTAIVPRAEVHHGYAASERRRADRVPTDLSEIGASWAVFLAKHCEQDLQAGVWRRVTASERRRLVRHMVAGTLEPRDVNRLMRGLQDGFEDGQKRQRSGHLPLRSKGDGFVPFTPQPVLDSIVISGRSLRTSKLRRQASNEVATGRIVTLIRLSPTSRYHHIRFTDAGVWEHTGGLFGKSERSQPTVKLWRFNQRVQAEADRVRDVRLLQ